MVEWPHTRMRPPRLLGVAVATGLVLALLRLGHTALAVIRSDEARLLVPALPVVPAAQPVVAQEFGRVGQVFVREGMAVAPGQPLVSLQRDPELDQELVDRGVARDLSDLNEQIRDAQRVIDALNERMVMAREPRQPWLEQQQHLAGERLRRREQLWQQGGLSRDLVDAARAEWLTLQQRQLEHQQDSRRLKELQQLRQLQQGRLQGLLQRQSQLRQVDQQRRQASRRHPRLLLEAQAKLDYATYTAPGRGIVLRLLKRPGDPVRPREAVAIWQRDQQPPLVEAKLPAPQSWAASPEQRATVEIPSLRQRYNARLLSWTRTPGEQIQARFQLEAVPAADVRRLLALPGEPVRIELQRRPLLNL